MATRLENLKVTKVDFVDQGANPDAHITLFKNKGGEPGKSSETTGSDEKGNVWKRMFGAIAKIAGMKPEEISEAVEQIEKEGHTTFGENMAQRKNQKIADEIWDICMALHSSLCSIMWDEELDSSGASAAMQESLEEFCTTAKDSISQWSDGKAVGIAKNEDELSEAELEVMKSAHARLTEIIGKSSKAEEAGPTNNEIPKGEIIEMSEIDKSKLTESERAFLESLEKRYGVEKKTDTTEEKKAEENTEGKVDDAVAKALQALGISVPAAQQPEEDIYKGLNPALKAEIESLRKYKDDAEEKELRSVAKSYELIGKKEDELYPVLKSMKAAGEDVFKQFVSALDEAKNAAEKSGLFTEVGKAGHPAPSLGGPGDAETKIDGIAKGYMTKDASMSYSQAVAKAWEDNPELMDAYEEEAGF